MRNSNSEILKLNTGLNNLFLSMRETGNEEELNEEELLGKLEKIKALYLDLESTADLFHSSAAGPIEMGHSAAGVLEAEHALWVFYKNFQDPQYFEKMSIEAIECYLFVAELVMDPAIKGRPRPKTYRISEENRQLLLNELPKRLLMILDALSSREPVNQNEYDILMCKAIRLTFQALIYLENTLSLPAFQANAKRQPSSLLNRLIARFSSDIDLSELSNLMGYIESEKQGKHQNISLKILIDLFKLSSHEANAVRHESYERETAYEFRFDVASFHSRLKGVFSSQEPDSMALMVYLKDSNRVLEQRQISHLQTNQQASATALQVKDREISRLQAIQQASATALQVKDEEISRLQTNQQASVTALQEKDREISRLKTIQRTHFEDLLKKVEAMKSTSNKAPEEIEGAKFKLKLKKLQNELGLHAADLNSAALFLKRNIYIERPVKRRPVNSAAKPDYTGTSKFRLVGEYNPNIQRKSEDSFSASAAGLTPA